MANDIYSAERAGIIEQLAKLAGSTTWREPMGGYSTKSDHVPNAHALAASLAMARRGAHDIGPDLLAAVATRTEHHRTRIVPEIVAALRVVGGRVAERNGEWLLDVAARVFVQVVHGEESARPKFVSQRDFDLLVGLGCSMLWQCVETTGRRVAKAYRAAA